jgi:hypothetical protein
MGPGEILCDGFRDGVQVPAGDAGLEDEVFVGLRNAAAVVDYRQLTVPAGAQGGGDVDVAGAGVARVAQELEEGVLDGAKTPRAASEAFDAREASKARSQVPVRSFQGFSIRAACRRAP